METAVFDAIEEYHSEDIMSINHSRLIQRISVALENYDDEFDTFPELEIELPTGKVKPDICVYPNLPVDWLNDIIYFTQAPLIAIEILSPRQAMSDLTDKAFKVYFPGGVKVVWLVIPMLRMMHILLPDGSTKTFSDNNMIDPITGINIPLSHIFR